MTKQLTLTVLAHTAINHIPTPVLDTREGESMYRAITGAPESETQIDELHEFAGRACYQSWQKPNPATRSNEGYLGHILDSQHESVLEHGSVTFYVEHVSRALLLELERHRHLSFSVESQRYVDPSRYHSESPVIPPLLRDEHEDLADTLDGWYQEALAMYDEVYKTLRNRDVGIKQAREAARAFLPESTPVNLVVTANLRAWRYVINKRIDPSADREIQEFSAEVLRHLKEIAPHSVQDFEELA